MKAVIRVDASTVIGTGHVMRCLTLADMLSAHGVEVTFVSRELPGNLIDFVRGRGYDVRPLPHEERPFVDEGQRAEYAPWLGVSRLEDAHQTRSVIENETVDWLIVDHYALDIVWEKHLRPLVGNIMVIDDLADRSHDCDVLLDQNVYHDMEKRYDGLVPDSCRKLLGPTYALLRPEFLEERRRLRQRDGSIKRILIFFGGVDPSNETARALRAILALRRSDLAVDVIVGKANRHGQELQRLTAELPNTVVHRHVDNMAELMAAADIAIGAGGTTTWERCCLGLPAMIIAVANNQLAIGEEVARYGAAWYMGTASEVSEEDICSHLRWLQTAPERLQEISEKGKRLVDGEGARRVTRRLLRCNVEEVAQ